MVWLTHPIMVHSSRERGAINHTSMTDEQAEMITAKWLDVGGGYLAHLSVVDHSQWYHADWDYGQTTVAFFCAGIGAATLLYATVLMRDRAYRRTEG